MKILYCSWYENSREDLERALNKAADEVIVIEHKVKEYLGLNENIRQEIISIVVKGIDIVISFVKKYIINAIGFFCLREMV